VEIVAVLIGLTISVVVSISANLSYLNQAEVSTLGSTSSILVAGLPFVLIAMIELCKIPLAFAFMAVKNYFWKLLFLLFAFFLCLITFETMLNGFERNFSNLNYAIDSRKNDIENINAEISLLDRKKDRIQTFTKSDVLKAVEKKQAKIDNTFKAAVNKINKKTVSVLSTIDYSFKDEIDAEIGQLMNTRDSYYKSWNEEIKSIEKRLSSLLLDNVSGSKDERQRLLTELEQLKLEMQQKLDDANFLTSANVEKRYRKLIKNKNYQLSLITTGYLGGDALTQQAVMEQKMQQQIIFTNNKYEGRIKDINQRINDKKQQLINKNQANSRLRSNSVSNSYKNKAHYIRAKQHEEKALNTYQQKEQAELDIIQAKAFEIDDQIFALKNDQRSIQAEVNQLINQNQIHRLAMYAYGKRSPTEVDRHSVGIVALLWFGSLALIASVTGIMLAVAGFYLRRQLDIEENTKPNES